jgi:hypothetical protein
MALVVFLSHSHHDRTIAAALARLIGNIFDDRVSVDYSSDQTTGGGIPPGALWLPWILDHITSADRTFVLLTPNSMHRPWLLWESGAAAGVALAAQKPNPVVPITFGMKDDDVPSPFSSAQAVKGDSDGPGGVRRILQDLNRALGSPLQAIALNSAMKDYCPGFVEEISRALKSTSPLESVLAPIPHLFSAEKLVGLWVTTFTFTSDGDAVRHHADISELIAESDRRVRAINHAPQTEKHKRPFFNEIEAEIANRHLIGHWKNRSDERYFGTVHLAVLSGECVMEGRYTSFHTDVATSAGNWKWVRLETAAGGPVDLKALTLRHPAAIHASLADHSGGDGPIALDTLVEKK